MGASIPVPARGSDGLSVRDVRLGSISPSFLSCHPPVLHENLLHSRSYRPTHQAQHTVAGLEMVGSLVMAVATCFYGGIDYEFCAVDADECCMHVGRRFRTISVSLSTSSV